MKPSRAWKVIVTYTRVDDYDVGVSTTYFDKKGRYLRTIHNGTWKLFIGDQVQITVGKQKKKK